MRARLTRAAQRLVCVTPILAAPYVDAQVVVQGESLWTWQASSDNGATWRSGLVETAPSSSLRLRAVAQFPTGPSYYFGTNFFDMTVQHAGGLDTLTSPTGGETRGPMIATMTRFGDTLKLDRQDDSSPPGQGPFWIEVDWYQPELTPIPAYSNPVVAFDCLLFLDTTPGDRIVSGVFRSFDGLPYPSMLYYKNTWPWGYFAAPITQHDLTVRVIPAPASLVAFLAAMCVMNRRR